MYRNHNQTTTSSGKESRFIYPSKRRRGRSPSGQINPVFFAGDYPVSSGAADLSGPSVNLGAAVYGFASVNLVLRVNLGCSV